MEKQRVTFEQIVHANKFIDTTDIKGKSYAQVNQRIKAFRMLYPEGRIKTEIVSENDGKIIMKATIFDESGTELSNAFSYEKEGSSNINRTSYIENCETSAIGRALGFCGLGIDVSIASFEEVNHAIELQEEMDVLKRKQSKDTVKEFEQLLIKVAQIKTEADGLGIDVWGDDNIKAWVMNATKMKGSEPATVAEAKKYIAAVQKLIDRKKQQSEEVSA